MASNGHCEAIYRHPNLVVPLQLRYEQFLNAMLEGLKHRGAMPEHLAVQEKLEAAARARWVGQSGCSKMM